MKTRTKGSKEWKQEKGELRIKTRTKGSKE